jgi:anti-anti-sigma factor
MTLRQRKVAVKQLPESTNLQSGRAFYRDLGEAMNVERPAIVLDCSRVHQMDQQTIYMLLNCLEGAMKRNGDVRLAAVSQPAMRNLEMSGVDRLFRIFATVDQAVASFQHRAVAISSSLPQAEANAA